MNAGSKKASSRAAEGRASPLCSPLFLCWLSYTSAYLGRYSYNSNITAIISAFGVSHADAGLVTTCFFFAYGIGQVVNGLLCRFYPKRWIVPLALSASAALNLAVFFGSPFWMLKFLWLLNGAVQSILWPTLISVLSKSLSAAELRKSVVVMSTTVPIGTFLAYGASALLAVSGNFPFSFLIGAVCMAAVSVVWLFSYRETAQKDGEEKGGPQPASPRKSAGLSLILTVAVLSLFAVANNLVKDGLTTWVPSILKEKFGLHESVSILLTLVLPVLGMFGASCNTVLEKKVRSFISLSAIWYLLTSLCVGGVILLIDSGLWWVTLFNLGLISLFMHAVNNAITSMAPLYMRDQIDSGLLAGLLNGFCYVGSTVSSYGLGSVADRFGWNGVFSLLLAISCIPVVIAAADGIRRRSGKPC